jgi:PhzF family phenazine biosynthesis protein
MSAITVPVIYTRVFGATPESGNPCPVITKADALTTEQMQGLTAQFGVETAFILSPQHAGADLRLRYFVPLHEMEMCVHATVGVVTVLARQGRLPTSTVKFETPLGILPVHWQQEGEDLWVTVEQFPPTFAPERPSGAEVAAVLGIAEDAIDLGVGPIQPVSVSRSKLMIPLVDFGALDSCAPDAEQVGRLCERYHTTGLYPFTLKTRSVERQVEARQFPRQAGYLEDAATGVAAAALAAYLVRYAVFGAPADGWHHFTVGQGEAMGQPSLMRAAALVEAGQVPQTRITGLARILAEERKVVP